MAGNRGARDNNAVCSNGVNGGIHEALVVSGVSHHTADVDVRALLALDDGSYEAALSDLVRRTGFGEGLILSTCNRFEAYVFGAQGSVEALQNWLSRRGATRTEALSPYLYTFSGHEAIRHVFRVACGLDSQVLGETQIQGQVRDAFARAQAAGTMGPVLARLLQTALGVAKRVRTETGIGRCPVSLGGVAAAYARRLLSPLEEKNAVVVGAGENAALVTRHLCSRGMAKVIIVNRTFEHACSLAEATGATPAGIDELPKALTEADVVICSTGAGTALINAEMIASAVEQRPNQAMLILDLAVPRDVDPAVGSLPGVYLYSIDDLKGTCTENLRVNLEGAEAQAAAALTHEYMEEFVHWMALRAAVPSIRALRSGAQEQARRAGNKALRRIRAGEDPEEVIRQLTTKITNALLHPPTVALRLAARAGDETALRRIEAIYAIASRGSRSELKMKSPDGITQKDALSSGRVVSLKAF